jgi:hypothetical protein
MLACQGASLLDAEEEEERGAQQDASPTSDSVCVANFPGRAAAITSA